jgi:outer membrane protein TolC
MKLAHALVFISLLLLAAGCANQGGVEKQPDTALIKAADESRRWIHEEASARDKAAAEKPTEAAVGGTQNAAGGADALAAKQPIASGTQTDQQAPPLAEKATLEAVLRLAGKNNPMVAAAMHRWLAATHQHAQAVSLPDPSAEATYFARRGMENYMLGLSQAIPLPGKLIIAGRIADKEAEAARLRYEAAVRDALSDAKEGYFELYYIDRAQKITEEIKGLYDRYAALAAGGKDPNGPKLPETFRAESQRAQLAYDLVLLREMRAAEAERLRAILGLPSQAGLGVTEDVAEPAELGEKLERLQEIALEHNQELAAAGVEVQRAGYAVQLAHRTPIPDLMVGANYTDEVPRIRKLMGIDNAVGVTAGISLPLWFPKYQARTKEAEELAQAAHSAEDASRLQVRADLAKAYFSLTNSSRLVRLYKDTLIPQARQALQSAEELYRNDKANLAAVLETTATVHNFELARLRATADYFQNVARIERVLGVPFKLGPPESAGLQPANEGGQDGRAPSSSKDQFENGEQK